MTRTPDRHVYFHLPPPSLLIFRCQGYFNTSSRVFPTWRGSRASQYCQGQPASRARMKTGQMDFFHLLTRLTIFRLVVSLTCADVSDFAKDSPFSRKDCLMVSIALGPMPCSFNNSASLMVVNCSRRVIPAAASARRAGAERPEGRDVAICQRRTAFLSHSRELRSNRDIDPQ